MVAVVHISVVEFAAAAAGIDYNSAVAVAADCSIHIQKAAAAGRDSGLALDPVH